MGETVPAERDTSKCGERSVAALPGGAEPFAGRVGWRGLPLRTNKGADSGFRRTNGFHPRLRVSAGLRFAVRSLFEALDREITKFRRPGWYLIHRKTRVKSEEWRVELAPASEA